MWVEQSGWNWLIISSHKKQRLGDFVEFWDSLVYIASARTARARNQDPDSKRKPQKQTKKDGVLFFNYSVHPVEATIVFSVVFSVFSRPSLSVRSHQAELYSQHRCACLLSCTTVHSHMLLLSGAGDMHCNCRPSFQR